MTASKNAMAWFAVFLLAISSVFAADEPTGMPSSGEDFTASGTSRILTFACSPAEGQITVHNTGIVPSAYELFSEGKARKWVVFDPQSFVLDPGQSQTVNEHFSVPCDAEDASLDVVIATNELELVLSQEIIVQTPNNLVLLPVAYSQEILPCDSAEFVFVLHNPAEFAETYFLKVLNSPAETAISDTTTILEPHQNKTISITVHPKDCSLSGDFTPVLQVKTEKSRIMAEIEMYLHINNSDIPLIAEGIDKIRALFEPQEAQLRITNTGDRPTTYTLLLEAAPSFITVQPEKLTIAPRDSENIKLILQPAETTPQGKYPIKLTAIVDKTGKEYTKELTLILKNPTFADKLFKEYLAYTIIALSLIHI